MGETKMKKILLLGGSAQQVVAIETAKRLDYYTILCDFLENNPGRDVADKFFLVSTTDKEKVLEVAQNERIDGVIAYASDPAAPTAAFVAEKMGLPTNPYISVETLCNKDKFRQFLYENGFNTPIARGYVNKEDVLGDMDKFSLPVIIKPVDSSGSKGATVLKTWDDISSAIDFAFSFSRTKKIIVEEFIEKKHQYLVGGDLFIVDGQVVLWGLLNCHRDNAVNSLVPVGKSYPLLLDNGDIREIEKTLNRMIDRLGLKFGSINVELIVDKEDKVWLIDVGPRAGGNMIPDLLSVIFNVDVVKMAVLSSMGEQCDTNIHCEECYYATYNLHSSQSGTYEDIVFLDELEKHIIKKCLYKKKGDKIEFFDNASKALGIIFMRFPNASTQKKIMENINDYIHIKVRNVNSVFESERMKDCNVQM